MYSSILNLLENYTLIGDNLNVDFYNDKFKNQPTQLLKPLKPS